MTPRASRNLTTKTTYFISCEGSKTEPIFFNGFRSYLKDLDIIDELTDIEIVPNPPKDTTSRKKVTKRGNSYEGKKRTTNNTDVGQTISGYRDPVGWVIRAKEGLEVHNIAWAVFDKDNHPAAEEAFELADAVCYSGKKLNIAFSSRCIEHYLLLHFECSIKAFEHSECKKNKKEVGCGRPGTHPSKDCGGTLCINGYARLQGYWQETKDTTFNFKLIQKRLWQGVYNSIILRNIQDKADNKPIWKKIHIQQSTSL